jgi:DNA invertase Pin-like site-specific DNA recombinase
MARGWEDVHVVTSLEELLRVVRSGRVEIVLCSRLERLAHSFRRLREVVAELVAHKTALIIPSQGVVNVPPEMILKMLDCVIDFRRCVARENISAGLNAARRRGVRLGRPKIAHRYREDVAKLRARGLTGRAISQVLGLSSSSVFRMLDAVV